MKSRNTGLRKASRMARLPSATVTSLDPELSATSVEMPPPNWTMKVFGRLLDHIGVVHRQVTEVGRLLVGEMAHDADRAVAVDVEAEIGVGRHFRQVEAGVVGQARREMQVGGRVGLEEAERRPALVDLLRFGQPPRVGGALVVVDGEARQAEIRRDDEMAAEGDHGRDDERREGAPRAGKEAPRQARGRPQRQRRGDQVDRREDVHRAEKDEAAQARAGQIGEIDAAERLVALEEHAAEEHRAGEKRRQRGEEDLGELPFLVRVRDEDRSG